MNAVGTAHLLILCPSVMCRVKARVVNHCGASWGATIAPCAPWAVLFEKGAPELQLAQGPLPVRDTRQYSKDQVLHAHRYNLVHTLSLGRDVSCHPPVDCVFAIPFYAAP